MSEKIRKKIFEKIKKELEEILNGKCVFLYDKNTLVYKKPEDINIISTIIKMLTHVSLEYKHEIRIGYWNEFYNEIGIFESCNISETSHRQNIVINPNMIKFILEGFCINE